MILRAQPASWVWLMDCAVMMCKLIASYSLFYYSLVLQICSTDWYIPLKYLKENELRLIIAHSLTHSLTHKIRGSLHTSQISHLLLFP